MSRPEAAAQVFTQTRDIHKSVLWQGIHVLRARSEDNVNAAGLNITSLVNRYDVVNLTLGASVLVNDSFTVRPAMVLPLNDDQFDYEAMVQMNFWR